MPGGMTVAQAAGAGGVRASVRGATAADVPAITRFLHGFWPQIPPATWRSLFEFLGKYAIVETNVALFIQCKRSIIEIGRPNR